jgi:hypothetical protein
MAAWLSPPVQLHSMRMFECGDMSVEDCDWYKQRWHFWYEKSCWKEYQLTSSP